MEFGLRSYRILFAVLGIAALIGCQGSRDNVQGPQEIPGISATLTSYELSPCDDRELQDTHDPLVHGCNPPICESEALTVSASGKLANVHGSEPSCRYQDSEVPISFPTGGFKEVPLTSATLDITIEAIAESPSGILQKQIGIYANSWIGSCAPTDPVSVWVGCNEELVRVALLEVGDPGHYTVDIPLSALFTLPLTAGTVFVLADDSVYSGPEGEVTFTIATVENKPAKRPLLTLNAQW